MSNLNSSIYGVCADRRFEQQGAFAEAPSAKIIALPEREQNIYEACREFVLTYALPELAPENVIQGWQNRASLPPETNDYAVISIISANQRGTTVETLHPARELENSETAEPPETGPNTSPDASPNTSPNASPGAAPSPPGTLNIEGLIEIVIQIDFCGETDTPRQRARRLATVARSSVGAMFFADRTQSPAGSTPSPMPGQIPGRLSSLYADDVKERPFTDEAHQFVRRYSTNLHLSAWSGISVEMPYFTAARAFRVENVDAHHKQIKANRLSALECVYPRLQS